MAGPAKIGPKPLGGLLSRAPPPEDDLWYAPSATPYVVQANYGSVSTAVGSSSSATFDYPNLVGSAIIIYVQNGQHDTPITCSDTAGNTYRQLGAAALNTAVRGVQILICPNCVAAQRNRITVSVSGSASVWGAIEVQGLDRFATIGAYGVATLATPNSTPISTSTPVQDPNAFLLAVASNAGTLVGNQTNTSGFTQSWYSSGHLNNSGNSGIAYACYKTLANAAPAIQSCQLSSSNGNIVGAWIIAFNSNGFSNPTPIIPPPQMPGVGIGSRNQFTPRKLATDQNALGWLSEISTQETLGTLAPATNTALTQDAATGSLGTAVASITLALTEVSATGAVGTLSEAIAEAPTEIASTGSVGTLAEASVVAITEVFTTGSLGTAVAAPSAALTEIASTGSTGTVSPSISQSLTEVASTLSAGTLVAAISEGVSEVNITAALGAVIAATAPAATQVAGSGAPGTLAPSSGESLSEVSAAIAAGAIAPIISVAATQISASLGEGVVGPVDYATVTTAQGQTTDAAGAVRAQVTGGGGGYYGQPLWHYLHRPTLTLPKKTPAKLAEVYAEGDTRQISGHTRVVGTITISGSAQTSAASQSIEAYLEHDDRKLRNLAHARALIVALQRMAA